MQNKAEKPTQNKLNQKKTKFAWSQDTNNSFNIILHMHFIHLQLYFTATIKPFKEGIFSF